MLAILNFFKCPRHNSFPYILVLLIHFRCRQWPDSMSFTAFAVQLINTFFLTRLAPVLKKINQCDTQSKTSYKYMIWHIDEKLFQGRLEPVYFLTSS